MFKESYGGEVEILLIDRQTGMLFSMDQALRENVQSEVNTLKDRRDIPIEIGYDSSTHLVEIRAGVYDSLISLVSTLKEAINKLQKVIKEERNATLLSI